MGVVVIGLNSFRVGGSQTYALTLASILRDHGISPLVVAKPGPLMERFQQVCEVLPVRWREGVPRGNRRFAKTSLLKLSEARIHRRLREYDVEASIASQPFPTAFLAEFMAVNHPDRPMFALVHGMTEVEFPPARPGQTIPRVDRWFAATKEAETLLAGRGLNVARIGNVFRGAEFWGELPSVCPLPRNVAVRLLFSGTLTPNKTPPLYALLDALADHPSIQLRVAGDGPERAALEEYAYRAEVAQRLLFLGNVLDMRDEIRSADLMVAVGRAAIEGASRGIPVIVANSDGIHGVLTPQNFRAASDANFTGRSTSSIPVSGGAMSTCLNDASNLTATELRNLQERVWEMGDVQELLQALHGGIE